MSSERREKSNKRSAGNPADDVAQVPDLKVEIKPETVSTKNGKKKAVGGSTTPKSRTGKKMKKESGKFPTSKGESVDQVGPSGTPSTSTGAHGDFCVLQEDGIRWKCTLDQTGREENENKFFIIELLRYDKSGNYTVRTLHGRVGEPGKTFFLVTSIQDLSIAKAAFEEKFREKTGNEWSLRHDFVKVYLKYDLVNLDKDIGYGSPKSPLNLEMHGDYEAPLGQLSKRQIDAGYNALMEIKYIVKLTENQNNGPDPVDYTVPLNSVCNKFYTRIPQRFARNVRPPLIDNMTHVQEKLSLFVIPAERGCRLAPCGGMMQRFIY